jgi:hypothetical protein
MDDVNCVKNIDKYQATNEVTGHFHDGTLGYVLNQKKVLG